MTASTETAMQQFLSFQLSRQTEAILLVEQLVEILQIAPHEIVPISDVNPSVMGVCNWRGEVLWLLDLSHRLGFEPLYAQPMSQPTYNVLVLRHGNKTLGLVVYRVGQMIWVDSQQIQELAAKQVAPELLQCLRGYWLDAQGDTFLALDGSALLNSL